MENSCTLTSSAMGLLVMALQRHKLRHYDAVIVMEMVLLNVCSTVLGPNGDCVFVESEWIFIGVQCTLRD